MPHTHSSRKHSVSSSSSSSVYSCCSNSSHHRYSHNNHHQHHQRYKRQQRSRSRSNNSNTISNSKHKQYNVSKKRIQSIINVVSKSTGTQKGRGNFHQNGKNSLLAWEEEDYSLANKKLINYGIKYKSHNNQSDKGWKHDKYEYTNNK